MSFHPNEVARRGRRASMIVSGVIAILLIAFFRTQVLAHSQWVMQSEENRLRQVPIPAPRGVIYDRKGEVIAENAVSYNVSMLAKSEGELKETMERLSELIPMTRKAKEDAVKRFRRDVGRPAAILPDASFDQVAVLEEHRTDFPSLIISPTPKRIYPEGKAVWAFAGYTAEVSEQELAALADSGYRPGQQIGKYGLEVQYESTLRGKEGSRFVEVDAKNRIIREQGARPDLLPVAGDSLKTNIDLDLQRFVYQMFVDSAVSGAAIAVDPKTGGILAIHTSPPIDPNRWIGGMPKSLMDSLLADTLQRPLVNKALQGTYPPGSTWKLATAAIALEDGTVTWNETFPQSCGGSYYFGNRAWKCWKPEGHGRLNLAQAITVSCDVYFYQLGLKMGLPRLAAGGARMGFGSKTGVDLPNEKTPSFPVKYQEYLDAKWGKGRWLPQPTVLNLSIGQGENSQTLLNMARFYTALAGDGTAPTLRIVQDTLKRTKVINLPAEQMEKLREAMLDVLEAGGTAAASAIQGVPIAGKTGTAQSGRWVNGEELDHAWFTGIAPAGKGQDPKIVVVVMLEYGGHGSRAAKYASQIIGHYLKAKTYYGLGNQGG